MFGTWRLLRDGTEEPFVRRGKIGGWRDYVTLTRSATIDGEIVAPLKACGVHLTYE